jgi:hypothetical protein
MKSHSRHYDRLNGDERFLLYLAATARGDEAEAAELSDTCPKYTYRMRDWSFIRREAACRQIIVTLALELAPHVAIIRELDWRAEHTGDLMDALALTGFHAAIEAHWAEVDPGGSAENRLERGLPMPDVERIMEGPAGAGFVTVNALQTMEKTRREEAAHAVSMILEAFNDFACRRWGLTAREAIATHAELFGDLDDALVPYDTRPKPSEETERIGKLFERLWETLNLSA